MDTKYDTSNLPDIGVLITHSINGKVSVFRSECGRIEVSSSEIVPIEEHQKRIALIAAAPALLIALIELVNRLDNNMMCSGQQLKNTHIAIKSALGLKQ